ncbi:unnamed protein product [Dovyalis caffra]|uniref:Uncharacterized protein n=1 Tax=Dovyalis caffra TaxID=77055 RepID=A0AAV1R2R3_9ROSI|nr:unnamed protein product [Dovyalis caffra]
MILYIETMEKFERDGGAMNVDVCGSSRGEDEQVKIDVDSLASSVEHMMSQKLTMSDKCCIFKVPYILRRHSEKAYLPNAFSIGPWHRDGKLMKATEKVKLKYLKGLLSQACKGITLKGLIEAIREIEKLARECYAGQIDMDEEEFVKMLAENNFKLHDLLAYPRRKEP